MWKFISSSLMVIMFLATTGFNESFAQPVPDCISEQIQRSKVRKYSGAVRLPDGRIVYRISVSRPHGCMDCGSGVVYLDSLCRQVAGFTIGIAPQVSVAPGYHLSDFAEASMPVYKNAVERKQRADSTLQFNFAREFRIVLTYGEADSLFQRGDLLQISHAAGMRHTRSDGNDTPYKIIPHRASQVCSNQDGSSQAIIYYVHSWKKYIKVSPVGNQFYFYESVNLFLEEIPREKVVCLWRPILLMEQVK